jgi:hypothetical protein
MLPKKLDHRVKEIYPFEYGGEFYLLDVEGMVPHKIPESK